MKLKVRSEIWRGVTFKPSTSLFSAVVIASGLFSGTLCQAADRHVRPVSDVAFNGDGSSWTAAASNGAPGAHRGLPVSGSLVRGDVYYVADGAYGRQTFNTPTSSTTPITIRKATVADHGTSTGWNNSYGDGQAAFSGQLQFTTRYWVVDGVVGGGPSTAGSGVSSWKTGHGFKVTETGSNPVIFVNGGGNVDVSHIELVGAGNDGTGGGVGNDAFSTYNGTGPNTLSYAYAHDMGRCMFYFETNGALTASYCYFGKYESTSGEHSEFAVLRSSSTYTLRWSIVTHIEGTGGIIGAENVSTAEVYGNVFFRDGSTSWPGGGNGLIAAFTSGPTPINWKIYNNTFVNIPSNLAIYGVTGQYPSGNQARNNLYFLASNHSPGGGWTQSYEHFQDSGSATGTNSTTRSGDPFVNYANFDFRLTANTPTGTSLPPPYDKDMYGNSRTSWSRGAVEFNYSTLIAPSNLRTTSTQ